MWGSIQIFEPPLLPEVKQLKHKLNTSVRMGPCCHRHKSISGLGNASTGSTLRTVCRFGPGALSYWLLGVFYLIRTAAFSKARRQRLLFSELACKQPHPHRRCNSKRHKVPWVWCTFIACVPLLLLVRQGFGSVTKLANGMEVAVGWAHNSVLLMAPFNSFGGGGGGERGHGSILSLRCIKWCPGTGQIIRNPRTEA